MASPRDKITLRRIAESSWVRPFAFLILIIVLWDLTVRLFKIPPYLIPAPKDVIIAFWTEGDKLLPKRCRPRWRRSAALPSRPCSVSRWRC